MNTILELLSILTVAGSVVVVCILLLRIVSIHAIPPKWRYRISKMALGFYLLPVVLGIQWVSRFFTFKFKATTPISNQLPLNVQHTLPGHSGFNPKPFMAEQTISTHIALLLLSLWGLGAVAFAAWQTVSYRRLLKILEQTRSSVSENSEAAKKLLFTKQALGVTSKVQLAYSSAVRSPVLVGLWKPTIYLPMENTVDMDMGMVIHHELIHLKRKDLWVKAFTLGASALHWFNPLVHILQKDIHTWSELSCDEEVVKGMSYAERKRYGETILNVMAGSRNLPVRFCASLSGDGKQLKRRLTIMLSVKKLKKKTVYLTITAVFLVAAISTTAAAWASSNTPKVVEDEKSQFKAQSNEVTLKPIDETKTNEVEVSRSTPASDNETNTGSQIKENTDIPKAPDASEKSAPDPLAVEELIMPVDEGYRKSHLIEIPPGTSITVRSMTPEKKTSMKELEEELQATMKLEESIDYDERSHK